MLQCQQKPAEGNLGSFIRERQQQTQLTQLIHPDVQRRKQQDVQLNFRQVVFAELQMELEEEGGHLSSPSLRSQSGLPQWPAGESKGVNIADNNGTGA
ncbi:hypothetical protein NQZ68_027724 [Dissostichus eleginoides]|nr:hypothetical protein NQZ68_027724 [Dissostichus eleginoides]